MKTGDVEGMKVMCEALMEAVAEERERANQAEETLKAHMLTAEAEKEEMRALESEFHKAMVERSKAEGELHWLRDEIDSLYVQNESSLEAKQSLEKALEAEKQASTSHERALHDERLRVKERDKLITNLHKQQQEQTERESGAYHHQSMKYLEQEREWKEKKTRLEEQIMTLQ